MRVVAAATTTDYAEVPQPSFIPPQLAELVESGDGDLGVGLVEELTATDGVAFDCHQADHPPFCTESVLRGSLRRMSHDDAEVVQPMHGLDVDTQLRRKIPGGAETRDQFAGRSRRRDFVLIKCGISPRDNRPRVRVGGRLTGEIPCVEFLNRGVDVIGVKLDCRNDLVVSIGLDNAERFGMECLRPLVPARSAPA